MTVLRPLALVLAVALAAAAERLPLAERPLDTVTMIDGRTESGRLIERREDGTILLQQEGKDRPRTILPGSYSGVDDRILAPEVVARRGGQSLAQGDWSDVLATVRWGAARAAERVKAGRDPREIAAVADAVIALARKALTKRGDQAQLAEIAAALLIDRRDFAGADALIRPVLTADPTWNEGHALVMRCLELQKRDADVAAYAQQWLARSPTSLLPNLVVARASEARGDLRAARDCWKKAFELHQNPEAAVGYARTALRGGRAADALRAAESVLTAGAASATAAAAFRPEALAWAGCAALALGEDGRALDLLRQAESASPPAEVLEIVRYDLGLVLWRSGKAEAARKAWAQLSTPAAQFALAVADRRPMREGAGIPEALRPLVAEHNACVALEHRKADQLAGLSPTSNARHLFLSQAAQVLRSAGAPEAVRQLAAVKGDESVRWQLYGHLIAGRWDQAEAAVAQLPPDDGYAAVARVYLAAARKDPALARQLFRRIEGTRRPPADYVRKLAQLYQLEDDEVFDEAFDWPHADQAPSGWTVVAQGTGIRVTAREGRLHFEGTQTAGTADPVTRLAREVDAARLRVVRLELDLGGAAKAAAGLELTDLGRQQGAAIAVMPGGQQVWRELRQGKWQAWQPLRLPAAAGARAVLQLECEGGLAAVDPEDSLRRQALATGIGRASGRWQVGVFAVAEPGGAFDVQADHLRIQLRAEEKRK